MGVVFSLRQRREAREKREKLVGRAVGVGGLSRVVVAGFLCLARAAKSLASCPGLAGEESKRVEVVSLARTKKREKIVDDSK